MAAKLLFIHNRVLVIAHYARDVVLPDNLYTFLGLRPVSDDITEAEGLINVGGLDVMGDAIQCFKVAVYV